VRRLANVEAHQEPRKRRRLVWLTSSVPTVVPRRMAVACRSPQGDCNLEANSLDYRLKTFGPPF
jgi:hypothetical protein